MVKTDSVDRPANAPARFGRGGLAAVTVSALALVAVSALWATGGAAVDVPWAPTLDLRLTFELDAVGALYALLATGVGLAVFVYSQAYLPRHLARQERPLGDQRSFYAWMTLFMASMVGLATAQDLILIFVFWDLTAIASYFLIAYDRHERSARVAALMALLVTGITAVLLLIGALVLYAEYGTFSLPELFERAQPGAAAVTVGAALIGVSALAKSAQVPFHFWLPQAMKAPTPVSAYLHSAAMVAAGVLLLARVYPLLETSGLLLDGLMVAGFASIAVGGLLALTSDELKRTLAYSTFSQYGYVVVMYGAGGEAGAVGASFYVVSHAVSKSALFLTAGAVTEATGRSRLSELGGLARSMPVLAAASAVAAAGVAALPLTVGFFGDELFFKAAAERGTVVAVLAAGGAALTLAYMARFWGGIFLGSLRASAERLPGRLVYPVAALAAIVLAGGVAPGPLSELADSAGSVTLGAPAAAEVAYHPDARSENLMALAAYGVGALVLVGATGRLRPALERLSAAGRRLGPERAYHDSLRLLNLGSDRVHTLEVRDLRTRIVSVLLPAGVLVVAAIATDPLGIDYSVGSLEARDAVVVLALGLTAGAALAATRVRKHLALVLAVTALGYALAGVYALSGAPDLALVAVLVETLFALLFLGVFTLLPGDVLRREEELTVSRKRTRRNRLVGAVSGGLVFLVMWGALSQPAPADGVAQEHVEQAPDAHAADVVTAILADFRGFDTLGEITVLAIALAGVAALLRRGRLT